MSIDRISLKNNLTKIIKSKCFYLCLVFAVIDIFAASHAVNVNGTPHFKLIVLCEFFIEALVLATYYYFRKKHFPPEKLFLVFAIPLGVLFLIFLPPGQSPDEINHFKRAYSISEGHLVAETFDDFGHAGSPLPVNIQDSLTTMPAPGTYTKVVEKLSEPAAEEHEYSSYNNIALYHWACFIPQATAALIGRLMGFSLEGIAYLIEIFDFIIFVILIYFAIKFAPKFKTFILFIALLPITLQEATSLAPDALAISLCIFLTSYVCHLAYIRKTQLKTREIILLYSMALLVGFCKIVYLPLVLLYLIIPAERFGSKKQKWIHALVLATLLLMLNLNWLSTSTGFLVEFNPGVNSAEQISYILHNPLCYVITLFSTLNTHGSFYLTSMLGMNLGSFSFNLPNLFFFISYSLLVVLMIQRDEYLKIKPIDRAIFAAAFLAIFILIFTSIYVQWTPAGASLVDGVQGRYFLPILLLIPIVICRTSSKPPRATLISSEVILCYSLFINISAIVCFFCQNF